MPRVAGFELLSAEHRAWLLGQWRRTGYGDNARIAEELNARLAADGLEASYEGTTVWRWAKDHKASAAKIRYAAELRAATIAALPDDDPALSDKVGAYLDSRIVETFEQIAELEDIPATERAEALGVLSRANTAKRKIHLDKDRQELARARFEAEQEIRRAEREKAAGAAETAARQQGLGPESIAAIRAAITGAL